MVDTRKTPRSRRADILAAAEQEFASAGYAGARIERIAALARVNKQLLFHYFQSKSGLLAAVLESLLSRIETADQVTDDPAAALRSHLTALERFARQTPGLVALLADSRSDTAFPREAAAAAHAWIERLHGKLSGAVEDGQRRGYYRDDIDPAQVARLGVAAALGVGAFSAGYSQARVVAILQEYCAWR
jgi:TetR/AcrR family transcriptional regulator